MSSHLPPFDLVAAADRNLGIGKGGRLPWRLPREMRYFRDLTTGADEDGAPPSQENAVVMGRRTWESIPEPYRPLGARKNVVVTRDPDYPLPANVLRAVSLEEALALAGERAQGGRVFVIGGAQIYRRAIELEACAGIYLTRIFADYDCDAFFPAIDERIFELAEILDDVSERGARYRIEHWRRIR